MGWGVLHNDNDDTYMTPQGYLSNILKWQTIPVPKLSVWYFFWYFFSIKLGRTVDNQLL